MEFHIYHPDPLMSHRLPHLPDFSYRKGLWEWEYLLAVIQALESDLQGYQVILTDQADKIPYTGAKVIVFLHSVEANLIPNYINSVGHVFKQYAQMGLHSRLTPLPLGYNSGFLALPFQPLSLRPIDVLFCGDCLHTSRAIILSNLLPKLNFCKAVIRSHVNIRDYAFLHWHSKIALCLDGQKSVETYRFYESLKMGNLILASPQAEHLTKLPYIPVNWNDTAGVVQKIQTLLQQTSFAESQAIEAYNSWKIAFAPEAVAHRIRLLLNL